MDRGLGGRDTAGRTVIGGVSSNKKKPHHPLGTDGAVSLTLTVQPVPSAPENRSGALAYDPIGYGLIGNAEACGLNANPHGRVSELLVTVMAGTGVPLDTSWLAANSTSGEAPARFETHRLPLASNARPAGSSIELPLLVRITAGTGVPDAVTWLAEYPSTLNGPLFPFATQMPPAASIAIPRGLLSELDPSSPITIPGVGDPVAVSWLGLY
jgi:hypothetical protein